MTGILVATVLVVMIIAVLAAYYVGTHMKRKLDEPDVKASLTPPVSVTLSEKASETLARLTSEPIFLDQAENGLRVQFDNQPLVPVAILTDAAVVIAVRELASMCAQRFGARWTALATFEAEGRVSVQRLS